MSWTAWVEKIRHPAVLLHKLPLFANGRGRPMKSLERLIARSRTTRRSWTRGTRVDWDANPIGSFICIYSGGHSRILYAARVPHIFPLFHLVSCAISEKADLKGTILSLRLSCMIRTLAPKFSVWQIRSKCPHFVAQKVSGWSRYSRLTNERTAKKEDLPQDTTLARPWSHVFFSLLDL